MDKFITKPNLEPNTDQSEMDIERANSVLEKEESELSSRSIEYQRKEKINIKGMDKSRLLSLYSLQDAIIWSEILGKPLSKRRTRRSNSRFSKFS